MSLKRKNNKKGGLIVLINFLVTMLALMLTAYFMPGISIDGIWAGLGAALILGLVNIFIKPLLTVITLPLTIITLGLFLFVINGLMLMITAKIVEGFHVSGLLAAILGSIVLSLVNGLLHSFI